MHLLHLPLQRSAFSLMCLLQGGQMGHVLLQLCSLTRLQARVGHVLLLQGTHVGHVLLQLCSLTRLQSGQPVQVYDALNAHNMHRVTIV